MRVVREGVDPKDRWYTGTCYYCKTVVEFQEREGKYLDDQRDGVTCEIQCPKCSKKICGSPLKTQLGSCPESPDSFGSSPKEGNVQPKSASPPTTDQAGEYRCPKCGYSLADAAMNGDHWLCVAEGGPPMPASPPEGTGE